MALVGFAKRLWQCAMHEVLQLLVNKEVNAACQQWLKVKHLALNVLYHSYELSKRRLLFRCVVVSCRLHIPLIAVYKMLQKT